MIFDRPSTRTRVSFDVGMRELGGETIMLTGAEMQLGRGETIADTARVLSRYVEAIVPASSSQDEMLEMADDATVPVINGLTKQSHPCQVMADILTFEEMAGPDSRPQGGLERRLQQRPVVLDRRLRALRLHPRHRLPAPTCSRAAERSLRRGSPAPGSRGDDPQAAVADAAAVISDCWVSMGDEDEERRHDLLAPYQVNAGLMAGARPTPSSCTACPPIAARK